MVAEGRLLVVLAIADVEGLAYRRFPLFINPRCEAGFGPEAAFLLLRNIFHYIFPTKFESGGDQRTMSQLNGRDDDLCEPFVLWQFHYL